jgi:hypothetical protein
VPIDLVAGLTLAKTSLDIVKGVREALKQKKLTPDEMKDYLDTLQDKLVDVKTALADADDERRELLKRIEELTRMADFGKDFKLAEGVYWREGVPYCPVCWDVDRKTARLFGPTGKTTGFIDVFGWECCFHDKQFGITKERSVAALK